jgi:hypothetical protein
VARDRLHQPPAAGRGQGCQRRATVRRIGPAACSCSSSQRGSVVSAISLSSSLPRRVELGARTGSRADHMRQPSLRHDYLPPSNNFHPLPSSLDA